MGTYENILSELHAIEKRLSEDHPGRVDFVQLVILVEKAMKQESHIARAIGGGEYNKALIKIRYLEKDVLRRIESIHKNSDILKADDSKLAKYQLTWYIHKLKRYISDAEKKVKSLKNISTSKKKPKIVKIAPKIVREIKPRWYAKLWRRVKRKK